MNTTQKIFLLDMDGCVADTVSAALALVGEEFDMDFSESEWTDYSHPPYPKEVNHRIFALFQEPDFYARPQLRPGAREALELARSKGAQLHFATDRPPQSEPVTRQWLVNNRLPFDSLRVGPLAKQEVLDAFPDHRINVIEDNPQWITRHSDRIRVNIMLQPWTREITPAEMVFQWSKMATLLSPSLSL